MNTLLVERKERAIVPDQSKDNRRGARFSVNLTGNCYLPAETPEKETQANGREGAVKDISSWGACILTKFPLNVSEVLKVAFPIQNPISSYISTPPTLAEVRWTHSSPDNNYISGFRFLL
jgi:hypothetical protein